MDGASVMSNHIVLDGLPENVTADKREGFLKVLKAQVAKKLGHDRFEITLNSDSDGLVFSAFIAFVSVNDADKAVAALNKWKFTKTVECRAYFWSDFEKFAQVPDQFVPPDTSSETLNRAELKANDFLFDEHARPQFLIKGGEDLNVEYYWFGRKKTADLIKKGDPSKRAHSVTTWSEMDRDRRCLQKGIPKEMPMWSPQGTYLVTQHAVGLRFWGGKGMEMLSEIIIDDLQFVAISPNETYAITYSRDFGFWNVIEGRCIRSLGGLPMSRGDSVCPYKYNADDTIVGIANLDKGKETLSFYHAASMKLISPDLHKYTAKALGLKSFEWSPSNPKLFACVIEGTEHSGWCIEVNSIETDGTIQNVSRRNVLHAIDLRLMWHPSGTHMAARVSKLKNGETLFDYIIFSVSGTTVAVHSFEAKGRIMQRLWWAQNKPRFCVRFDAGNGLPAALGFYTVEAVGCRMIGEPVAGEVDSVWWSSKGKECVTVDHKKSCMDFIVVDDDSVDRVAKEKEHKGVTHLSWDPSGRFVASYVSTVDANAFGDPGYKIWSVFGDMLCESQNIKGSFSHFTWRPLPRSLLSPEHIARIEKELPERRAQYESADAEIKRNQEAAAEKQRLSAIEAYKAKMTAIAKHHEEKGYAAIREELRAKAPSMKRQREFLAKNPVTVTETFQDEIVESEVPLS